MLPPIDMFNNAALFIDIPERPQDITVVEIQSRSLVISWIKPHDNNAPILGYFIFYEQPSFAGGEMIIFPTADEGASLTELFPGVTYNFTVIAYNAIGNSTESDSIQLKTLDEGTYASVLYHTVIIVM